MDLEEPPIAPEHDPSVDPPQNETKIDVQVSIRINNQTSVEVTITDGKITRKTSITSDKENNYIVENIEKSDISQEEVKEEITKNEEIEIPKDIMQLLYKACERKDSDQFYNLLTTAKHESKDEKRDEYEFYYKDATPIPVLKGIDVNEPVDEEGNTLLHLCGKFNFTTGVVILNRCGANMNPKNSKGEIPLHVAIHHTSIQTMQLLLKYNGDLNAKDEKGRTPMELAVELRKEGCCSVLIESGAEISLKYKKEEEPLEEDESQYDEYGFIKEKEPRLEKMGSLERIYAKRYMSARRITLKKAISRSKKWQKMIKKISKRGTPKEEIVKKHQKMKSRVRKGIPNAMRAAAWKILLPIENVKKANPGVYERYINEPSPHSKQIDLDIPRTFPRHRCYRQRYGKHQCALFRVLKAYSIYDPAVGYCQGMNSVVALLLLHLEEEDAFWALTILMSNPKYAMADIFRPGFPKLMENFYVHEQLLKKEMPKLYSKFSKLGVESSMYATKWYMTLMLEHLPFDVAVRIWDIYFSEGYKVVFNLALALLKMYESELLKMDFEKVMSFFGTLDKKPIDVDLLVDLLTVHKVKNKVLKTYIIQYKELLLETKRQNNSK